MRWRVLAVLVKILADTAVASDAEGVWPNVVEHYTHDDTDGLLPETQAVDRDYRHYYQLVALELLLVHHGLLKCESRGYSTSIDDTKKAIEEFQRNHDLLPDALNLDTYFWNLIVVAVQPGEENEAVLALKWLLDSTSEASRPPTWDASEVDEQGCTAYFDGSLLHKLEQTTALHGQQFQGSVTPSMWQAMLNADEVRGTGGCNYRAFVAHTFGVAWVVVWITMGLGFTVLHNDSSGQGSKMLITTFFRGKTVDRLPTYVRRTLTLSAFSVCHTLALVGIWSFPLDFVADLLTGCYWTIASLVVVRLAAPGSPSARPYYIRAVEVTGFIYVNMALYFLYIVFPQEQMWRVVLLVVFTVFAGIATAFASEGSWQLRLIRGGLLLVTSYVALAVPSMLMLIINIANRHGIVLLTIMPTLLQLVLLVSEGLAGRLYEKHSEYSDEAKWLLAMLFRFYIELVRFQTALAVLLLSVVTGSSFFLLAVHLVQSFLYDIMGQMPCEAVWKRWKQQPERSDSTEQCSVEEFEEVDWPPTVPYDDSKQPPDEGAITWAGRSRAMLLPIEVVLLATHLCQLIFMGMPVGISGWSWMLGLFCMAFVSGLREALAKVISRTACHSFPDVPWSCVRGHTAALVFSAGLVASTLVQIRFSWILYAHHLGSCFMSLPNDDRVSTPQDNEVPGVLLMAFIAVLMLTAVMCSFFLWFDWAMRSEQSLDLSPKLAASLAQDASSGPSAHPAQNARPEVETSTVPEEAQKSLARTWERTLHTLWADAEAARERLPQPPQPPEAKGEAALPQPASYDQHFFPKEVDVDKSIAALLHEVAPEAVPDEPEEEARTRGDAMAELEGERGSATEAAILQDVLADLPDARDFASDEDVETKRIKSAQIERLLSGLRENEAGWSINDADVSALLDPAATPLRVVARNGADEADADPSLEALGELLAEDMDIDRLVANIDLQDDGALDVIIEDAQTPLGVSDGSPRKALLQDSAMAIDLGTTGNKLRPHDSIKESEVEARGDAHQDAASQVEETTRQPAAGVENDGKANVPAELEEQASPSVQNVSEGELGGTVPEDDDETKARKEQEKEAAEKKAEEAEEARRKAQEDERARQLEEEARHKAEEEARVAAEEEAARIAAELERRRMEAAQALSRAVEARDRQQLEVSIREAEAVGVDQEALAAAVQVLQDVIQEEQRSQAELALAEACKGDVVEVLQHAIAAAESAGASEAALTAGRIRLEELLEAIRRKEAARQKIQDLLEIAAADTCEALAVQIEELSAALQEAASAGVQERLDSAQEHLDTLRLHKRRLDAIEAMKVALSTNEPQQVHAALEEAKAATVDADEIARVERALEDLMLEIDRADKAEKALQMHIDNLASVKQAAQEAKKSADVEQMLGEGGALNPLQQAIADATQVKLIKKESVLQAEDALQEAASALTQIMQAIKAQEKADAEETLLEEIKQAQAQLPTTLLVVEGLRQAIKRAEVFDVDTQAAEGILAELVAENERQTKAALQMLEESLAGQDLLPQPVSKALAMCRSLLLDDAVRNALTKVHEWCQHELHLGQSCDTKTERMVYVGKVEAMIAVLRENGAKDLRKLHNDMQDLKGALRVFCRVRPLSKAEQKKGDTVSVDILDHFTLQVHKSEQELTGALPHFSYDAIFGPDASQTEVYTECRSLLQSCYDGYNITIFSYGQTGAGKTWTLYGTGSEPGISPRTCKEVFLLVEREAEKCDIEVDASMVELYLNDLRDLLTSSKSPPKLEFKSYKRPDGSTGMHLDGITYVRCEKSEDLAKAVAQGLGNRKTRRTNMNADSSRSHLLLTIRLTITDKRSGRHREGKITIVDLAGSERLAKSGVTGEGQQEAIQINKSLTALGDVMMAFTSGAKVIPYRNHKLTQLMQDSLGGNAKTLMFVNVSPAASNADETINALKYASRARCIENDFRKNAEK